MKTKAISIETFGITGAVGVERGYCFDRCGRGRREARRSRRLLGIAARVLLGLAILARSGAALAQQVQDNWYLYQTWSKSSLQATNGGLSSPYGVAIGPDGRVYVGDQGNGCIQVYQSNGVYSFSITNGFGGGQSFSQPRGMITDTRGNLYVADQGKNCVYEFTGNGAFIQKFGSGSGSGNGQLSGAMDVAVGPTGLVYVVENGNSRLSVFNTNGTFNSILIGAGSLASQLYSPVGVTISDGGTIVVAQNFTSYQGVYGSQYPNFPSQVSFTKFFDSNGNYLSDFQDVGYALFGEGGAGDGCGNTIWTYFAPSSVRFDRSGLLHDVLGLISSWYVCNGPWGTPSPSTQWHIFNHDGSAKQQNTMAVTTGLIQEGVLWPCSAVGPDGTMIFCDHYTETLQVYRYAKREVNPIPRNAPSMPEVLQVSQRQGTGIVDVYYQVTDQDDTNSYAGILVFTSGNQSLSDCLQPVTFIEGTATNINATVPVGQSLHLAWNVGADWATTNLSNYRVGIMAKDNRQGFLDVHYVNLPADHGMPALEISASPVVQSDFSQVWWWLLATNDPGIKLANGIIYGAGGGYSGQILCNGDNNTTAAGRGYIFAKMGVRQATAAEVSWASIGPNATLVNTWSPAMKAAGRPLAVNEYGFDTGNWGANAWWIVPLH